MLLTFVHSQFNRHFMVLLNQKKCHAGKHAQDSMEEQTPFKKAQTGDSHVELWKHSATCKEPSRCFDGRMHTLTI